MRRSFRSNINIEIWAIWLSGGGGGGRGREERGDFIGDLPSSVSASVLKFLILHKVVGAEASAVSDLGAKEGGGS